MKLSKEQEQPKVAEVVQADKRYFAFDMLSLRYTENDNGSIQTSGTQVNIGTYIVECDHFPACREVCMLITAGKCPDWKGSDFTVETYDVIRVCLQNGKKCALYFPTNIREIKM